MFIIRRFFNKYSDTFLTTMLLHTFHLVQYCTTHFWPHTTLRHFFFTYLYCDTFLWPHTKIRHVFLIYYCMLAKKASLGSWTCHFCRWCKDVYHYTTSVNILWLFFKGDRLTILSTTYNTITFFKDIILWHILYHILY